MGRSDNAEESRCKKHPKHREYTGVCPFCLRERLSHLSSPSFSSSVTYPSSSSAAASSSPCLSDSDSDFSSLTTSPVHPATKRSRLALLLREGAGSNAEPLKKCRSLILVVGRGTEEDDDDDDEGKERENCSKKKKKKKQKKKRFWSKFLSGPSVGREGGCTLTHSKTLKERPATKWVLFS
ncbi:uncharacterized protein LOC109706042 [Ananas comosus]|uniref:Uncharacterized protein LOC109706042 n=1 Tax=Ananas comosus TaxID=4615 RepID=A0A6P5EG64_ANACO|nr:uncharacterized protein LOC109706042 [Ananas comosus]